jgi:hypothetical protein
MPNSIPVQLWAGLMSSVMAVRQMRTPVDPNSCSSNLSPSVRLHAPNRKPTSKHARSNSYVSARHPIAHDWPGSRICPGMQRCTLSPNRWATGDGRLALS